MRDFGFWVRIIAISQLGFLVLANYGDGWLSPDNPILVRGGEPVAPKPLSQIVEESRPKDALQAIARAGMHDPDFSRVAGWGGSEEPAANWDEPDEETAIDEFSAFDPNANSDEETDWGKAAD